MRKEIILAIVLGLILGAIIVFGYWRANQVNQPPVDSSDNQQDLPTQTNNSDQSLLTILAPHDGDIFDVTTVTISGTTLPSARVIIVSENEQLFVVPNEQGYFNDEISLDGGVNRIQISAIDTNGQRVDKVIQLVYTTELDLDPQTDDTVTESDNE
jgi:hypothetical protein